LAGIDAHGDRYAARHYLHVHRAELSQCHSATWLRVAHVAIEQTLIGTMAIEVGANRMSAASLTRTAALKDA
jgi:hypothetical protein